MERLEQQLIDSIQSIELNISYHTAKIFDAKSKKAQEMNLDQKSVYELKKLELMKLFTGLTANNIEETRQKYDEIMKGIRW
jgi:hypothetical protein